MAITARQLIAFGWNKVTDANVADLNRTLEKFNISDPEEIAHFMAQVGHESRKGFYTQEIANGWAYENREDLGNTESGDGPKFKGAGYIQLTGRANYQAFADYLDDMDIVLKGCPYVAANYPWLSAGFWWYRNGMGKLIAAGASVERVTRRVNGGTNGLDERIRLYNEWKEQNPVKELIQLEPWVFEFIEDVMGDYWKRMEGNKEAQDATHYCMNQLREATGREKQD